ncbi:hypothetical protein [Vibrio parahaemolyticus]|uniref:hypothetical protein n=1 Tax=Vibrio parahaemolyticus TaxID=670 RepID=UPI0015DE949F|nr:hypothetical protein [Vibrio parahaemolyticus]
MSNTKKRNDEKRKSPAKLAGQSSRTKGSYPALLGIESASVRSVLLIKLWKLVYWRSNHNKQHQQIQLALVLITLGIF